MLDQKESYYVQIGRNGEKFAQRWASLHAMKTSNEVVVLPNGNRGLKLQTCDNPDLSICLPERGTEQPVLRDGRRAIGVAILDEKALEETGAATYVIIPLLAAML